ncbi:MAG: hypothetical protein KJZ78_29805 [Bryobacteraceae bacterium]|nr:hypothetical protein [Bryobacteraceae bacterium]
MTKITMDPTTSRQLPGILGAAELCDEGGERLGYFIASHANPGALPPGSEIPLSIEETKSRCESPTGRALDQILDGLGRTFR